MWRASAKTQPNVEFAHRHSERLAAAGAAAQHLYRFARAETEFTPDAASDARRGRATVREMRYRGADAVGQVGKQGASRCGGHRGVSI